MSFNSTLRRKTPMKRTGFARKAPKPMKRTAIKRAGKKTNEWERVRAKLKVEFKRSGIMVCELGRKDCWRDNSLGFAHAKKRRNLQGNEIEQVALLCSACHDGVEILPEAEMGAVVLGIIAARKTPVASVF